MFHWFGLIDEFEIVNRLTIILALHQLLMFSIIRLRYSAREDALQSKIYCINLTLYLNEYDMDLSNLLQYVHQLAYERKDVMFNNEDIEWLKKLHEAIELRILEDESKVEFKRFLEVDKIHFEHQKETVKYEWTNSFLLNILK